MAGRSFLFLAPLLLALAGCDGFPRDADGALDRIRGGELRVGVIEHLPWAGTIDGAPAGAEVAFIERLAAGLDAEIVWATASSAELLVALEARTLDIVVGGLTGDSPWENRVALTRPYAEVSIVVAGPGSTAAQFGSVADVEVEAPLGSSLAAAVARAGGIPVPPGESATGLAARADWDLRAGEEGFLVLGTEQHVLALPQGENAWMLEVERRLATEETRLVADLRALSR